ncbi:hypothetical protein [Kribbella sp. NPDC006257]|uniref:hypothetical protein n=1 Tax=Kribbella sp. NPDC006257 TaxID=3156738 RepID=UPI0033B5FE2F
MEDPRYLYSEVVPRASSDPSLGHIPPRLIRAAQRYGELVQTFDAMTKQVKKVPVVTARLADLSHANPPVAVDLEGVLTWTNANELRLLVSEILHHLRVTADHLIYNVAWLDSGSEQQRTQFPVFKNAPDFQSKGLRMLPGVNAIHREWIEAVQPFNGVAWTQDLAYLSNNDKHNYLLEVVPTLRYRIDLHAGVPSRDDLDLVSLPVDNLETHVRLIRRDGGAYELLDKQLGAIMGGLAELLNRFLREAGISEVEVGTGSR